MNLTPAGLKVTVMPALTNGCGTAPPGWERGDGDRDCRGTGRLWWPASPGSDPGKPFL